MCSRIVDLAWPSALDVLERHRTRHGIFPVCWRWLPRLRSKAPSHIDSAALTIRTATAVFTSRHVVYRLKLAVGGTTATTSIGGRRCRDAVSGGGSVGGGGGWWRVVACSRAWTSGEPIWTVHTLWTCTVWHMFRGRLRTSYHTAKMTSSPTR